MPLGRLWRFPRTDLIELALFRLGESSEKSWSGLHVCLLPAQAWKNWHAKVGGFELAIVYVLFVDQSDLFVDQSDGFPRTAPDVSNVDRMVLRLSKYA